MVLTDEEADAGPRDGASRRERTCVATRTVKPVEEMIRFVLGPDDAVVPDLKGRLPGRGVWVTATQEAVADAVKRNAFARGVKRPARPSAELVVLTGDLIERAALGSLAMARKAGLVETGFARVESALAGGAVAALVHAADAAPDGVRKLNAAARQGRADGAVSPPVLTALSS